MQCLKTPLEENIAMFPPNQRLSQIEQRNAAMIKAAYQFRKDLANGKATQADLPRLKQEYPSFGVMPCQAADIEFVMFHAHDDIVVWEYLWHGADGYEPDLVQSWIKWCRDRPGVVLDIGAYSGLMSILAARAHPDNIVHLFEPLERIIERASVNIKLNGLGQRVTRHNVAASHSHGTAEIHLYRGEDALGTGSSIDPKPAKTATITKLIKTVSIDELLPNIAPQIVKIDVEGHELACLAGLEKAITRGRPNMLIESWDHSRTELLRLMQDHGYTMQRTEARTLPVNNYIALPRP